MVAFGETPMRVLQSYDEQENIIYTLHSRDAKNAVDVGIPATFPEERLEVMQARCLAHGYVLTIVEQPTQREEIV